MKEQLLRLSNQGVITARGTLKELLGDTLAQGATPREIAQRVEEWAKRTGDQERSVRWRAERIARTEASRSLNSGQVAAWEDMGVTRMKWLVAPNPCEFCEAVGKQVNAVGLRDNFFDKGSTISGAKGGTLQLNYESVQGAPLHPNCRCAVEPILRSEMT